MADIMTFEEHRGPIKGRKIVWSGDGNNVFTSFAHAAGQFGFDLTFTGPEPLDPDQNLLQKARNKGISITIERDPHKAVQGADLVVTDTWVSMHDPQSARERRQTSYAVIRSIPTLCQRPNQMHFSCIVFPHTAMTKQPQRSWTGPILSFLMRLKIDYTFKRQSCGTVWEFKSLVSFGFLSFGFSP